MKATRVRQSVQSKVDQLARKAVGTDAGDLLGLVEIGELATALAEELASAGPELGALLELAHRVRSGVEGVVLRETDAPEQALRDAHRTIDELQRVCNELSSGTGRPPDADRSPIDASLLASWIAGCDGMLADLEAQLLLVERQPADAEAPGEIRRILHTLKGECGVLALHDVQRVCHEAETLMDRRLELGRPAPVDILLSFVDWLHEHVRALASDPAAPAQGAEELLGRVVAAQSDTGVNAALVTASPPAPPAAESGEDPLGYIVAPGAEDNLAEFLCEAREHLTGAEEALLALERDATNVELVNLVFRAFHTIKGVAGFLHLTPIVRLAHRAEQLLDGARSGSISLGRSELDVILASCDMLLKLLAMVEGSERPSREDFEALLAALDSAGGGAGGEHTRDRTDAAPVGTEAATPPPPPADAGAGESAPAVPAPARAAIKRADQTVKVSTSRMDTLVTMVGELVIAQQMVVQDAASLGVEGQRALRTLGQVQKIVRDLQEVAMALRMVSLKNTFQRMTRLVRDVAVKAGKQIACEMDGEDVELDRTVVDEITDPLVHMIRNACDHGLEATADRVSAGKPAVGRVFLKAYHAGGSIVIEIGDDGRGLRREKLIAKGKERGLLPADADESAISDAEAFNLIFLPGFSTAESVTDISGRGVGMDVVRRNIEALRGKIEIRSTPGEGTTFLMRLPLTMAIIDGMIVRVGQERYVLPTLSIEHAFRPHEGEVGTVLGHGEMVDVRGRLLPIYRLGRVLGLEAGRAGPETEERGLLIVVEAGTSKCALMVDEIVGQQQVVIKSLGGAGEGLHGVAGGAILGDGRVALILDIGSIVANAARPRAQEEHGTRRGRPKESEKNTQIDAWDADSSVGRSDSGGREPGASGG